MLDAIAHRGPDAAGEYHHQSPQVWLGHRRLSIIDLSEEANQPFVSEGLVIVFNGEIYNYRELRTRLESDGIRFRTSSDTEVLLEAWRRWGPDALRMVRGMFAFALFEERTGRLVLARDPFGIKPLFIHRSGNGLAFASEAKALVTAAGQDLGVDSAGLVASLMYYWLPEEHSAYQGLEKLPPGHWAEIRPGAGIRIHRYWDPIELVSPAHRAKCQRTGGCHRRLGPGPPRRRRPGWRLPQWRPRLLDNHRPCGPRRRRPQLLHDQIP